MTSGRHTRSSVQRQRRPFFSAEPFARLCTSAPTPQWARRSFHPWGHRRRGCFGDGSGWLAAGGRVSGHGMEWALWWCNTSSCLYRTIARHAADRSSSLAGASCASRTSSFSTASFCNGCMARADKINRESGHAGCRTRVNMQKSEYGQEATRSDQGRVSANNAGTQFLRNTGGCLPQVRQLLMSF